MTDREPDDLYDALRDRLADYGQEPPAPLWANIRAQLPPPVAAPQLRQRTRYRRLAALALLLLLVRVGIWQWRAGEHRAGPGGPASHVATQATGPHPTPTASQSASIASVATQPSLTTPDKVLDNKTVPDSAGGVKQPAYSDALAIAEDAAAPSRTSSYNSPTHLAAAGSRQPTTAARTWPAGATGIAAVRRKKLAANRATAGAASSSRTSRIAAQPGATPVTRDATASAAVFAAADAAPTHPPVGKHLRAGAQATNSKQQTTAGPAYQSRALAQGQLQQDKSESTQPPALAATVITRNSEAVAVPLAVTLQLPTLPEPGPLAPADTLPPLPIAPVRRWAVQVLAGPALTSRTLQTGKLAYAPAPTASLPSNYTSRNVLTTSSAQSEQAAPGFGAELQLQRQLTGRWSLSTGLGYHTFATDQTVNVRVYYVPTVTTAARPDSTGTSSVRNTYHFLTVPLRLGYQLGTGHARLRYALLAGADVAFYRGGRSAEGSSAGIISQNWGASGSPYRPLSLALSLGAEVRYRLAPGWEVLAQPTYTHFLTSVAQPASGYVARYPLAATALVGVSYWLH